MLTPHCIVLRPLLLVAMFPRTLRWRRHVLGLLGWSCNDADNLSLRSFTTRWCSSYFQHSIGIVCTKPWDKCVGVCVVLHLLIATIVLRKVSAHRWHLSCKGCDVLFTGAQKTTTQLTKQDYLLGHRFGHQSGFHESSERILTTHLDAIVFQVYLMFSDIGKNLTQLKILTTHMISKNKYWFSKRSSCGKTKTP